MDDAALLAAWRAGDRRAGQELFSRHYASVLNFFRNKVHEADDLVQLTFTTVLEQADRFREQSSFRTYLFALAHNVLRKHLRSLAGPRGRIDFGTVSIHDLGHSPSSVAADREIRRRLLAALQRLPIQQQALMELHYWEHLTVAELAGVFEVPSGTIKTRMRAARQRLAVLLAEHPSTALTTDETLIRLEQWAADVRRSFDPKS